MSLKTKPVLAGTNGSKSASADTDADTITCTAVNGVAVDQATGKVTLSSATKIEPSGTGPHGFGATFTLHGKRFLTRGGHGAADGHWDVSFPTDGAATYYLTCDPDMKPSPVIITVQHPSVRLAQTKQFAGRVAVCLQLNPNLADCPNPVANSMYIAVAGTVLDGRNQVTCNLTPICDDGTSRGPAQTLNATMNGNAWTVMFTPAPTLPPSPPAAYLGLFLFEAIAPNEGTSYASIEVS